VKQKICENVFSFTNSIAISGMQLSYAKTVAHCKYSLGVIRQKPLLTHASIAFDMLVSVN